jgi:hypothetical protein
MRIGILGSELMGGKLGTIFARAGHEVIFSYARRNDKLRKLAREAQGNARVGTPGEATRQADAAPLADLGPRAGDGSIPQLHHRHGYEGLLLRSAEPLAARLERKHEWAIAAIPAEERGPLHLHAMGLGQDRSAPQSAATKNLGL